MTDITWQDTNAKTDDMIRIKGRTSLHGRVRIQGSKNATLPVLAACLLIPGRCILHNCPRITDVSYMIKLLEHAGCPVERRGSTVIVDATHIREYRLPGEYVRRMRSSVILMGAMLGRVGEVALDYPGGCVIGDRPIDLHLRGLKALGAEICMEEELLHATSRGLRGIKLVFPFQSVGATQNVLLASVLAEGETCIHNAACEPEIDALCHFLRLAGADIEGIGTNRLFVRGVRELHPVEFEMIPDRIVAGTYLFAALATGGNICIEHAPVGHLHRVLCVLNDMGGRLCVSRDAQEIEISAEGRSRNPAFIETEVYPGFPTDLQSLLLAAAVVSQGELVLKETIFSGRFKIVRELQKMGACISEKNDCVRVCGSAVLTGCRVRARELRGGAALVVAGLCADGITTVTDIEYIKRGYEDIVRDLRALGAQITISG